MFYRPWVPHYFRLGPLHEIIHCHNRILELPGGFGKFTYVVQSPLGKWDRANYRNLYGWGLAVYIREALASVTFLYERGRFLPHRGPKVPIRDKLVDRRPGPLVISTCPRMDFL